MWCHNSKRYPRPTHSYLNKFCWAFVPLSLPLYRNRSDKQNHSLPVSSLMDANRPNWFTCMSHNALPTYYLSIMFYWRIPTCVVCSWRVFQTYVRLITDLTWLERSIILPVVGLNKLCVLLRVFWCLGHSNLESLPITLGTNKSSLVYFIV